MRKSYSQWTQVQGDDGERVLSDEVDAMRDEWVEREEMGRLVECQEKDDPR